MWRIWSGIGCIWMVLLYGMESNIGDISSKRPELLALVVKGQQGKGGESFKETHIVNDACHRIDLKIPYRYFTCDLGQENCIKNIAQQIKENCLFFQSKAVIGFGCSQGTAALMGYVVQQERHIQEDTFKLLFLEAALALGNQAIEHSVVRTTKMPWVSYLPYVRLWLTMGAKCLLFPSYNPLGTQLIDRIEKLSPNIPVIVLHSAHDHLTPLYGALQLYCRLREHGNPVYLFETHTAIPESANRHRHLNSLLLDQEKERKIAAIQAVYKKYGLPYEASILDDFVQKNMLSEQELCASYQPCIVSIKERIDKAVTLRGYLRNCIDYGTTLTILCLIYLGYKKFIKSNHGSFIQTLELISLHNWLKKRKKSIQ